LPPARRRLETYKSKRDFVKTPEPSGGDRGRRAPGGRFVIQEHSATRLHWDLRLEHDGVLASWAVPNGIPDDPAHNRKAVRTEDHPLEYLDFEGDIPAGNYGAGSMRIWDRGTFEVEKWEPRKVVVVFAGERVQGRYALFAAGASPKEWLLHRMDPPVDPTREELPAGLTPMLARAGPLPSQDEHWAYEIKWDGVRALAYSEPGRISFQSRNGRDISASYPELRRLNRALGSTSAILDGEIVAFDAQGRPSFSRLQERMHVVSESATRRLAREVPVTYVIFDVLHLDGHSLMSEPYQRRRERLEQLGLDGEAWRTPAAHRADGRALLEASAEQGLEGLVAKRLDSPYEPGRRSPSWVKVKNVRRQELVIGGWLPGEGRRLERVGALLVGYHDAEGLRYAGRVGTGFTETTLHELASRLGALKRPKSPFVGRGVPRGAVFCEPRLVAEVEFTEWTPAGMLRHPSFKGLRDDKDPAEVVREQTTSAPEECDPSPRPAPATGSPRRGAAALFASRRDLPRGGAEVVVEGRELKLSNYDKVLFPEVGFTKGDLIEYYGVIAPAVLPHLRDRPLTLKRYPNGVEGKFFYEKQCPRHRPDWVQTAPVWSRHNQATINFCLAQDTATLVWAANLADIELHTSLARAEEIERPTMLAFDLDPGPPATIVECCEVALVLRGMFEGLGLQAFAKTSGSKGMQVYIPLNTAVTYAQTKPFARQVAELLEGQMPGLVVSRMTKSVRAGRVLVDWSQNDEHKTTVCVYSVRARNRPTVSTPITWEEVQEAHEAGDPELLVFDTTQVLERVRRDGDRFAPVLSLVQDLPKV
jgi:bifunctional non-homologous end joining protein LigD